MDVTNHEIPAATVQIEFVYVCHLPCSGKFAIRAQAGTAPVDTGRKQVNALFFILAASERIPTGNRNHDHCAKNCKSDLCTFGIGGSKVKKRSELVSCTE